MVSELDRLTDKIGDAAELLLPNIMAQDNYLVLSGFVFVWEKYTANQCFRTKDLQIVRRNGRAGNSLRWAIADEIHIREVADRQVFKNCALLFPSEKNPARDVLASQSRAC